MQTAHDYKRYAVLYVDDEEMALKYFQKTFGAEFRVLTAINAADGLKIIEEMGEEIGLTFEFDAKGVRTLCDYDGVFALPKEAIELLRRNGVIVSKEFE